MHDRRYWISDFSIWGNITYWSVLRRKISLSIKGNQEREFMMTFRNYMTDQKTSTVSENEQLPS